MTTRSVKSLIISPDTGLFEAAQPGDILQNAATSVQIVSVTNGESSAALVKCTPVYISGNSAVKRAQANASGTATVIGLIFSGSVIADASGLVQTDDTFEATTDEWDTITGDTGGLVFNTHYFLDASNPGKLTKTVPDQTISGNYNTHVGLAMSTRIMDLQITSPLRF